ncbi:MAG: DoxX family protein [Planctomycetota bacterium]
MSLTRIVGWVLCALVAVFLIAVSVPPKLTADGPYEMAEHIGFPWQVMRNIGVVELVIAVLLVLPRTGLWGALLLTAYFGGATASHVRIGDQFFVPIVMATVMWIGVLLRLPGLAPLLAGHPRDPRLEAKKD